MNMKRRSTLIFATLFYTLLLTSCGGAQTEAGVTGEISMFGTESAEPSDQNTAAISKGENSYGEGNSLQGIAEDKETAEETETGSEETQTREGTVSSDNILEDWLTEDGYLDLGKLQEINEDIYAWLDIPGTGISFPLLQSAEDEYFYLSHNEAKEADDGGCIYTEYFNRKDFSDPNTVIYGRNVDGRFAQLHDYQDRDYFDTYRTVNIYLEDRILQYTIFAAYNYDDRHLIKIYDFWDKDIYASYLETIFSQRAMDAYIDDSIEVTADDKIITLSTGVTGQDDRRYLVQAVQVSD